MTITAHDVFDAAIVAIIDSAAASEPNEQGGPSEEAQEKIDGLVDDLATPERMAKIMRFLGGNGLATFAEPPDMPYDAAHYSPDGHKVELLLEPAVTRAIAALYDLAVPVLRRLLSGSVSDLLRAKTFFDDAELADLLATFGTIIPPAEQLGAARIRLRAEQVNKFAETPTDFAIFDETSAANFLHPKAALEYFARLLPILGKSAPHAGELHERLGFTAAAATNKTVLEKIKEIVKTRLETGKAFKAAPETIEEVLEAAGIHPRNPNYAEMVFRTNILEAYRAGAQREFSSPELAEAFPVWKYIGIDDGRQRMGPYPKADHNRWFGQYFDRTIPFVMVRGTEPRDVCNCRCDFIPIFKNEWEQLQAAGAIMTPISALA